MLYAINKFAFSAAVTFSLSFRNIESFFSDMAKVSGTRKTDSPDGLMSNFPQTVFSSNNNRHTRSSKSW